ncbi:MAG: hypothetical protein EOO65_05580, partial [Methanosarcinales archaeon]
MQTFFCSLVRVPSGNFSARQIYSTEDAQIRFSLHVCVTAIDHAVGKSAFGIIMLWYALKQKPARTVIYLNSMNEDAWVFRANAAGGHDVVPFEHFRLRTLPDLKNRTTVLIADSISNLPAVSALTVLIASPKKERWYQFWKNDDCERLLFPPFSWEEIQAMHRSCYPAI